MRPPEGYLRVVDSESNAEAAQRAFERCKTIPHMVETPPHANVALYRSWFAREATRFAKTPYGYSVGYLMQATEELSKSRIPPLTYSTDDACITIGFDCDGQSAMAVLPMGAGAPKALREIGDALAEVDVQLFVKKIYNADLASFTAEGFEHVDFKSDFTPDRLPDDVEPEVITNMPLFAVRSHVHADLTRALNNNEDAEEVVPENYWPSLLMHSRPPHRVAGNQRELVESMNDMGLSLRFVTGEELRRLKPKLSVFIRTCLHPHAHKSFLNLDALNEPAAVIVEEGPFIEIDKDGTRKESTIVGCTLVEKLSDSTYGVLMHQQEKVPERLREQFPSMSRIMGERMISELLHIPGTTIESLNWGGSETRSLAEYKEKYVPCSWVKAHCLKYSGAVN